jgi:hypothetical protein
VRDGVGKEESEGRKLPSLTLKPPSFRGAGDQREGIEVNVE